MDNLFDLLTKSGYEVQTIGESAFPCTLMADNLPVAILMPDFSVRTVTGEENRRATIDRMVSFSLENQGMEEANGEYKLSQYKDVLITTAYDLENQQPVYHIYQQEGETFTLLDSSADREAALRAYTARSGLINADILQARETAGSRRLQNFFQRIEALGFNCKMQKNGPHKFEIYNSRGTMVGYIGRDNRVTLTTGNARIRRTLANAYQHVNSQVVPLPAQAGPLRQILQNMGMALRLFFGRTGPEYVLQENGRAVASMDEQGGLSPEKEIHPEQQEKLEKAQEHLRTAMEQAIHGREAPVAPQQQAPFPAGVRDASREVQLAQPPASPAGRGEKTRDVQNQAAIPSVDQLAAEAGGIFLTAEEYQALAAVLYENREELGGLSSDLFDKFSSGTQRAPHQETILNPISQAEEPPASQPETHVPARPLSQREQGIQEEFNQAHALLMTMEGFESPKRAELRESMLQQFGTVSPEAFQQRLMHGDFAKESLGQKLGQAQQKAAVMNQARQPEKQPVQKEAR